MCVSYLLTVVIKFVSNIGYDSIIRDALDILSKSIQPRMEYSADIDFVSQEIRVFDFLMHVNND